MHLPTPASDFVYHAEVESVPVLLVSLAVLLGCFYGCYRLFRQRRPGRRSS